ncbi:alpha/beta hydrolase [Hyphomicrobium sp.]|jgi:pimeloyl-ACP methyl ester carboxylesterase|uniref:alpha/beta fold hydrolase n=1 Tax=Hyphomicrobium sp. TaxID=82 RepID=UPI002D073658|nr:alpha/beta hydrolase [Hyphomicrobium sp.]HVZ04533.1 alpha/beta hydrolase [Hyphomicrobium sp.]
MTAELGYDAIYFTNRDGLRLYGRHYRAAAPSGARPILCLAGLTRNSRDFHTIALALSQNHTPSRDVFTLDTRGRGLSENDKNWKNYAVPIEMQDVIDFMTMLELRKAGIIGTSRGGLITMVLAAAQPTLVGPVVLNDIGPVIEMDGLARIAGYVGRVPLPKNWSDAARIVRDLSQRDFPNLTDADAEAIARQLFNEKNGKPVSGYDPKLSKCLSVLDGPIPKLWPQFEALKRLPLLVLRGGNSDLLSDSTVEEMKRRHPRMTSVTIPDQGHAPLLLDAPTISAVASFFAETDDVAEARQHAMTHSDFRHVSRLVSTSPRSTRRENSV